MKTEEAGILLITRANGEVYGFARKDPVTHHTRFYKVGDDMSFEEIQAMFKVEMNV